MEFWNEGWKKNETWWRNCEKERIARADPRCEYVIGRGEGWGREGACSPWPTFEYWNPIQICSVQVERVAMEIHSRALRIFQLFVWNEGKYHPSFPRSETRGSTWRIIENLEFFFFFSQRKIHIESSFVPLFSLVERLVPGKIEIRDGDTCSQCCQIFRRGD